MSWREARRRFTELVRAGSSVHRPNGRPNVFVFTTPRSGSTWLMELLADQPGFKSCSEPDDLRNPSVRRHLGISDWTTLYNLDSERLLRRYFEGFCSGRLRFMNPRPSLRRFRPVTRRIVFKLLHSGEDRIAWFRDTFNGRVVLMLRHPIPVSLSREVHPRLRAFLESDYRRHFDAPQLAFAERTAERGSKLERGMLDWCLQNAVPLRDAQPDWVVLSYEQLLLDPRPLIERMVAALELPDAGAMLARIDVPSRTVNKSDRRTARALDEPRSASRNRFLLEKWREKVDAREERRLMEILERFGIDVYTPGDVLPSERLWLGSRPAAVA
jgi:hypothetical protein